MYGGWLQDLIEQAQERRAFMKPLRKVRRQMILEKIKAGGKATGAELKEIWKDPELRKEYISAGGDLASAVQQLRGRGGEASAQPSTFQRAFSESYQASSAPMLPAGSGPVLAIGGVALLVLVILGARRRR